MDMKKSIILFASGFVGLVTGACQPVNEAGSSLMVIDGGPVTDPEQAPGTYGIRSYSNGEQIYNASAVAVSNNTLLTSGHVIANDPSLNVDRMDIVDYKGNVVHSFSPNDPSVKRLVNPEMYSKGGAADIGAYVLPQPIAEEKLTHGVVSVGTKSFSVDQDIHLVGNGIQDYRALDYTRPEDITPEINSGTLRWGTNRIAETDPYGFFVNGVAFDTPGISNMSVSGNGDSGGGVFATSPDGRKEFIGLMQGGGMFDRTEPDFQHRYFDANQNPSEIADQPNSAFSYVVDVTKQDPFLEQVVQHGGSVNGKEFANSATPDSSYIYTPPARQTETTGQIVSDEARLP